MLTRKIPVQSGGCQPYALAQENAVFDLRESGLASSASSSQEDVGDLDVEMSDKAALLSDKFTIRKDDDMSWASLLKLTVCIGG